SLPRYFPPFITIPYTTLFRSAEMRLNWYGHIRRSVTSIARRALDLIVPGVRPRGRPRMRWIDTVRCDMAEAGLTDADASDRLRRSEEHTSELQSRFDLVCRRL